MNAADSRALVATTAGARVGLFDPVLIGETLPVPDTPVERTAGVEFAKVL